MSEGVTTGRADRRAQRREVLLDAVMQVVRTEGPSASMERLAAGCGITKPILYRHFDGRDGLVLAVAERFVSQLADALLPILHEQGAMAQRLHSAIDAYLGLLEREPELYRFLSTQASEHRDVLTAMVAEHVALAVEGILDAAGRDTAAARPWAYGLVGMVHLAGDWWIHSNRMTRAELVEHLTSILAHGIVGLGLDLSPTATPLEQS